MTIKHEQNNEDNLNLIFTTLGVALVGKYVNKNSNGEVADDYIKSVENSLNENEKSNYKVNCKELIIERYKLLRNVEKKIVCAIIFKLPEIILIAAIKLIFSILGLIIDIAHILYHSFMSLFNVFDKDYRDDDNELKEDIIKNGAITCIKNYSLDQIKAELDPITDKAAYYLTYIADMTINLFIIVPLIALGTALSKLKCFYKLRYASLPTDSTANHDDVRNSLGRSEQKTSGKYGEEKYSLSCCFSSLFHRAIKEAHPKEERPKDTHQASVKSDENTSTRTSSEDKWVPPWQNLPSIWSLAQSR